MDLIFCKLKKAKKMNLNLASNVCSAFSARKKLHSRNHNIREGLLLQDISFASESILPLTRQLSYVLCKTKICKNILVKNEK